MMAKVSDRKIDEDGIATFINPYSYHRLRTRSELHMLEKFDRVYFDGFLMTHLGRLFGAQVDRRSFDYTSIADEIFRDSVREGQAVALIGGKPGVAAKAAAIISRLTPGVRFSVTAAGYFDTEADRGALIRSIVSEDPKYVIVGMGTPLQEKFLVDLRGAGWRGIGYTCGGFMHQTVGHAGAYYPHWVDRLNVRWLYRMYHEPSTRKRYLWVYPRAVLSILWDAATHATNRRSGRSA